MRFCPLRYLNLQHWWASLALRYLNLHGQLRTAAHLHVRPDDGRADVAKCDESDERLRVTADHRLRVHWPGGGDIQPMPASELQAVGPALSFLQRVQRTARGPEVG